MSRRSIRFGVCFAIVVAMVVGMVLSSIHVIAGHNAFAVAQAETTRHAALAADIADHGHSHDEGEPYERSPGHVHGHNTTDHVHETANLVDFVPFDAPSFVRAVTRHEHEQASSERPGGLERPPRSVVA